MNNGNDDCDCYYYLPVELNALLMYADGFKFNDWFTERVNQWG